MITIAKIINEYCISTVTYKNIAIKNKPIAINIFAISCPSFSVFLPARLYFSQKQ